MTHFFADLTPPTGIKNFFSSVKHFFADLTQPPAETSLEVANNNKFIAAVQKKFAQRRLLYGDFKNPDGKTIIRISRTKTGNKQLDIILAEDNSLIRSAVVDYNNNILEYNTSYPWRKFIRTGENYQSSVDVDAYMKYYLSDPQYEMEFIPKI